MPTTYPSPTLYPGVLTFPGTTGTSVLNTQQIGEGGMQPSYASATPGGDEFVPGARTFVHIKNGGAPITVTFKVYGSGPGGNPMSDVVAAVPPGEAMIGPFDRSAFMGPDWLAQIICSSASSVTLAVIAI